MALEVTGSAAARLEARRFAPIQATDAGLNSYSSVLIQTSRLEAQGSSSQH